MAEDWGEPPWRIKREAPAIWIDRWLLWKNEQANERQRQERKNANRTEKVI